MKTPKLEQFKLNTIKRKIGEIELKWNVETTKKDNIKIDKDSRKSNEVPHEDLLIILRSMRDKLAAVWGLDEENYSRVNITGINVTGKGESLGMVIMGTHRLVTGESHPIKSNKIYFKNDFFGFEKELQKNYQDLEREVYEYVWNDKVGDTQTQMFTDEEMSGMCMYNDEDE